MNILNVNSGDKYHISFIDGKYIIEFTDGQKIFKQEYVDGELSPSTVSGYCEEKIYLNDKKFLTRVRDVLSVNKE